MLGDEALILANSFTTESLIGGGALKGKNCVIESVEQGKHENIVHFKWTLDDGTVKTGEMKVKNGITPLQYMKNAVIETADLSIGDSFTADPVNFNREPDDNELFYIYLTTTDTEKVYLYSAIAQWHEDTTTPEDSTASVVDFTRIATTGLKALVNIKPIEYDLTTGGMFEVAKSYFNRDIDGTGEDCLVFDQYGHYQSITLTEKDSTTFNATAISDVVNINIGSVRYNHEQTTASDRWQVQHNLSFQYPTVLCTDDSGNEIMGDIEYYSQNLLFINFSEAVTGTAYISK